ncbi:hypothetical protein Tco_1035603 [Tanacetum coccineum]
MFYRENVDYPELIWEDFAFQMDHRKEKKSRRETMPYPRFTKVSINHFLKQHKSPSNLKYQHYHTIKDDGVVSKLKFVRIGEDYHEYRLAIPDVMLNDTIIQLESYEMFIKYSTGQIPPKKSRDKGSQGNKTVDVSQETIDVSEESELEPAKKRMASKRMVKKKVTISADDNIIPDPDIALEIVTGSVPEPAKKKTGSRSTRSVVIQDTPSAPKPKPDASKPKLKGVQSLTPEEQEAADVMQALKESKKTSNRHPSTEGSSDDDDDDDKDPPAGPNQGKASSKGSKTGKSASAKELVEEPIAEVVMDDASEDVILNWNNLEGDRYPFNLSKPLPLQGHPDHLTVVVDYFFNNDLEYLKSSDPERTYTTSITKTKEARYEIVGIEDMVPRTFGVPSICCMTKTLQRGSNTGVKGSVSVKKLHGYGHLEEVVAKRVDGQLCTFKGGDFVDLYLNEIEDMLLLAVQHKLFHLNESDIVNFIMDLRMFTRSLISKRHTFPEIKFKELYTPSYNPPGVIYEDLVKKKRVMRADEVYKFSNRTLKKVQDELHHKILDFRLEYNDEMSRRKWTAIDKKRSKIMVELIDMQMRKRQIIRNLERLVGARELEMDYKLMMRTV